MTDNIKNNELNWAADYEAKRDALEAAGAYDPAHEKSSCGVGLVASIDGTPRRDVVEKSIAALKNGRRRRYSHRYPAGIFQSPSRTHRSQAA
jgi:hypothetical protein